VSLWLESGDDRPRSEIARSAASLCASTLRFKIVRGEYEQHHPEVTTVVALPEEWLEVAVRSHCTW